MRGARALGLLAALAFPASAQEARQPVFRAAVESVYVDVFDSGFGQDSGYGHGI